jgi:hypothetical protein
VAEVVTAEEVAEGPEPVAEEAVALEEAAAASAS